MKGNKLLLSVLTWIGTLTILTAQPVIDNNVFPKVGTQFDLQGVDSPAIDINAAGPNVVWDFSAVQPAPLLSYQYRDASQANAASQYPDAELYVALQGGAEAFYKATNNQFVQIGFTTIDPILGQLFVHIRYDTPYVIYQAPIEYDDRSSRKTSFHFTFSADTLPDSILAQIPANSRPDSIRVLVSIQTRTKVDGWGRLLLPNRQFNSVLRESIEETRQTRILFYLEALKRWTDVTDLIRIYFPNMPLDPIHINRLRFFAPGQAGEVASVDLDTVGKPVRLVFNGALTYTKPLPSNRSIIVKPNPTFGKVTFYFRGLPPGNYQIEILNILGDPIWTRWFRLTPKNSKLRENLYFLPRGTYLYSIKNEKGEILTIKKLIMLKP